MSEPADWADDARDEDMPIEMARCEVCNGFEAKLNEDQTKQLCPVHLALD